MTRKIQTHNFKAESVGEITGNFLHSLYWRKKFLNKISWRAHEFSIERNFCCQVIERRQLIESRQLRLIGAALLAEKKTSSTIECNRTIIV